MAYPKIFRERVLAFIAEGNTQKKAIEVFKVSKTAIQGWNKLKEETGELEKRELKRKSRKYHPEQLYKILEETPDAYLCEIVEHFENGTISGVSNALKREKISLKKRQKSIRKEMMNNEQNIKNR